jgi:hypothetical protein
MPANVPATTPETMQRITSGLEVLKPRDVGIGRMIEEFSFSPHA